MNNILSIVCNVITTTSLITVSALVFVYLSSYVHKKRTLSIYHVMRVAILCLVGIATVSLYTDYSTGDVYVEAGLVAASVLLVLYLITKAQGLMEWEDSYATVVEHSDRYNNIFNRIPLGIAMVRSDGVIHDCNENFAKIVGRPIVDIKELTFAEFTYHEDVEIDLSLFRLMLEGDIDTYDIDKRYVKPNGEMIWVHLTVQWYDVSKEMFLSTVVEITDKKIIEIRRDATAKLLNIKYFYHNNRSKTSLWSAEFREMHVGGYMYPDNIPTTIHPEDISRVSDRYSMFIGDGDLDANYQEEYRVVTPCDGVRYVKSVGVKVQSSVKSSPDLVLGGVMDITEAKKREKELERSNAELEQFAYVASHDLQEPIRQVSNFVQLLLSELSDDVYTEELITYRRFILDGTTRMHQLVDDLLQFSRALTTDVEGFGSIQEAVESVRTSHNDLLRDTNTKIICGKNLHQKYSMSQISIDRIVSNLVTNSIKFKRDNVDPVIRISHKEAPGGSVVSFKDNGTGIPKEYWDKVFGLFTRLNNETSGTGIGLALCKRFATNSGGDIFVSSSSATGTTFDLFISEGSGNV